MKWKPHAKAAKETVVDPLSLLSYGLFLTPLANLYQRHEEAIFRSVTSEAG